MPSAPVPPADGAPTGVRRWVLGARPRTLPAAVVPVAVGAACAVGEGGDTGAVWWRMPVAGVVSLALQVGVNYANDYSDGVRGTDDVRVGPVRLVASGLASPSAVKRAALMAFGVAAVAGLVLAAVTTWWLLLVGVVSILAGWGYTGGPRPYGYLGLGEVFVFVFFGLVATAGTTFVVVERVPWVAIVAAFAFALRAALRPAGRRAGSVVAVAVLVVFAVLLEVLGERLLTGREVTRGRKAWVVDLAGSIAEQRLVVLLVLLVAVGTLIGLGTSDLRRAVRRLWPWG
mgnify:CR=1 FL=1